MDLLWGLILLLFSFVTGTVGETTCELTYKVWGTYLTTEFVCEGCCCGEATTRHCCTCWWVYVIGPICGLLSFITIGIVGLVIYKKKKKINQGRVLPQGQILHQSTGPGYSQTTVAVGGQEVPPGYPEPPPAYYPIKAQGQGNP